MGGIKATRLRNHTLAMITEELVPATGQYNACTQSLEFASRWETKNPLRLKQKVCTA